VIPLYTLLKKDTPFHWSKSCQEAYNTLKASVWSEQVLVHFNPKLPIIRTTDASNAAVAGVLSHICEDKTTNPIVFVYRALTKAEINYSTLEKEALAIVFSVMKYKQYLLGHSFVLKTDHKPLLTILGEHKGLPTMISARLQRSALILSGFNYTIQNVKGSLNDTTVHTRKRYIGMQLHKLGGKLKSVEPGLQSYGKRNATRPNFVQSHSSS